MKPTEIREADALLDLLAHIKSGVKEIRLSTKIDEFYVDDDCHEPIVAILRESAEKRLRELGVEVESSSGRGADAGVPGSARVPATEVEQGPGGMASADDPDGSNPSSPNPALDALRALLSNPHVNLGDLVYQVREREGEGWDGPAVKAWSDAVTAAERIVKEARDGNA